MRGGPTVQHIEFMRALKQDFAFHALIPDGHEMTSEYEAVATSVTTLPNLPTVPRPVDPFRVASFLVELPSLVRDISRIGEAVDAQLIHTFNEVFPAGGLAARSMRVPSVVHILGMAMFEPRAVGAVWSRVLRKLSARLVACQDEIANRLIRSGVPINRVSIVYNGIDVGRVQEAGSSPCLPPESTIRVGMVAGMDARKGHLDFIDAARRVRAVDATVEFYCIGSTTGDDRYLGALNQKIVESQLTSSFNLIGSVDNTAPWLKAMDIYCIPSRSEALSVAGLEAMALGRPIVATNVGGNRIAIQDGVSGLLCRPRDSRDLADKILVLVRNANLRETMGQRAQELVARRFSLTSNADALGRVFSDLVESEQ